MQNGRPLKIVQRKWKGLNWLGSGPIRFIKI